MDAARQRQYWFGWGLLIGLVCILFWINPGRNITAYREAAQKWMEGMPLYDDAGKGFLYAPHAAAGYVPFALLPYWLGEALWRMVNILVFAWGTWRLTRCVSSEHGHALLVLFLAVPLSYGSARNGQFNLVMGGAMMLAVANVVERRWWSAALWTWGAVALKPTSIVLALLLAPLFPALLIRSALLLPVLAVLPYLLQTPEYVTGQYAEFLKNLGISSSGGDQVPFAHIFWTLNFWGVHIPMGTRTILRVLAAGVTFALCLRVRLRSSASDLAFLLYGLAASYLIVFNPRTEGVTFAILGPTIGLLFVRCQREVHSVGRHFRMAAIVGLAVAILANYELGKLLVPRYPGFLLAPIAGVCIYVWMCVLAAMPCDRVSLPLDDCAIDAPPLNSASQESKRDAA